jgi:hypothetical protein
MRGCGLDPVAGSREQSDIMLGSIKVGEFNSMSN